jgi:hypothetical protein
MDDKFLELGNEVLQKQSLSQLFGAYLEALTPGQVTLSPLNYFSKTASYTAA